MTHSVYVSIDFLSFPGTTGSMNYWLEVGQADNLKNAQRLGFNYVLQDRINDPENRFTHRVSMESLHFDGARVHDDEDATFFVLDFSAEVE